MTPDCRLAVTVRPARDRAEVAAAQRLRVRVFCEEQGVSIDEELDGLDEESIHIAALDESGIVATCRLRAAGEGATDWKLERMAVDARLRGLGVGGKLLEAGEREAAARGAESITLNAQTHAEGFYASNGYVAEGERFESAGIEHIRMRKAF